MVTPGTYNGPTARICAELSYAIYELPLLFKQRAVQLVANSQTRLYNIFASNSVIGIVAGDNEIFVVFRGTVPRSPRSLGANINLMKAWWGNGFVHRGFLNIARDATPLITNALREFGGASKDLYFTGHSQGGAAAYLAAMTFALHFGKKDPSAAYTFGQPRAGDAQFTRDAEKRLSRKLSRIVNGRDVFVGVPFVHQGYDHTREYFHYEPNWMIARQIQMPGQGWPFVSASLADHAILQYLRRSHVN